MLYRRLAQEQLDSFTLDMNSAYARLKGIEEAIDSESCIAVDFFFFKNECYVTATESL